MNPGLGSIRYTKGAGTEVTKRVAAPLVGSMVSAAFLSLILIPVIYAMWYGKNLPEPR